MKEFIVTDCEFNRENYPTMIGFVFLTPPSYMKLGVVERERKIATLEDLIYGIPEEHRTRDVLSRLESAYDRELTIIHVEETRSNNTYSCLNPWRKAGSQYIAEFWVNDMEKAYKAIYNWHGQNTSLWLYAGAIVFDEKDKRISTHH